MLKSFSRSRASSLRKPQKESIQHPEVVIEQLKEVFGVRGFGQECQFSGGLPRTVSKALSMANCDKSDEIAKPAQKSLLRAPALGASGYQRVESTAFCPPVAVAEAMR